MSMADVSLKQSIVGITEAQHCETPGIRRELVEAQPQQWQNVVDIAEGKSPSIDRSAQPDQHAEGWPDTPSSDGEGPFVSQLRWILCLALCYGICHVPLGRKALICSSSTIRV